MVLRSATAAPAVSRTVYARNQGAPVEFLRRQARHFIEPYWMNPCGVDSGPSSKSNIGLTVQNKVDIVDAGSFKHHFQAIRNYAEALYKQVTGLKTRKVKIETFDLIKQSIDSAGHKITLTNQPINRKLSACNIILLNQSIKHWLFVVSYRVMESINQSIERLFV